MEHVFLPVLLCTFSVIYVNRFSISCGCYATSSSWFNLILTKLSWMQCLQDWVDENSERLNCHVWWLLFLLLFQYLRKLFIYIFKIWKASFLVLKWHLHFLLVLNHVVNIKITGSADNCFITYLATVDVSFSNCQKGTWCFITYTPLPSFLAVISV